jgi:hypothetical protein
MKFRGKFSVTHRLRSRRAHSWAVGRPFYHSSQSARLCAIKTEKQIPYGAPHSQGEQAPPPVLSTVVKHMATLAKSLQISHTVIGGIMVKVGSGQHYRGRTNCDVTTNSSGKAASACIAPGPLVFIPPSTIA